jgi:hypothetical protein
LGILIIPLQITRANSQTWDIIVKPSSHVIQIQKKKLMDLAIYEQDNQKGKKEGVTCLLQHRHVKIWLGI